MWSSPLHALLLLLLLQPAPAIPALPTKMQPRSEKQLTSVAGVTHTPQTRPAGATTGRPPGAVRGAPSLEPSSAQDTRAGQTPPAPATELGSRRLPDTSPFQTQLFPLLLRATSAAKAEAAFPLFPVRSTRPACTVPAGSSLPAGSVGAGKKFALRPRRTQPGLHRPRRLREHRAGCPPGPGLLAFPPQRALAPRLQLTRPPARRPRLRARSLPQAGAFRYASSQTPLSLAPPSARGRRRRERRGEEAARGGGEGGRGEGPRAGEEEEEAEEEEKSPQRLNDKASFPLVGKKSSLRMLYCISLATTASCDPRRGGSTSL